MILELKIRLLKKRNPKVIFGFLFLFSTNNDSRACLNFHFLVLALFLGRSSQAKKHKACCKKYKALILK
ncbi:MAG: hypothetical protein DBY24_11330 [Prevotellaceae bacterium]|nr:MAG: hypothetical protein DBY24_11330 [Prevotellaceae bacterium]